MMYKERFSSYMQANMVTICKLVLVSFDILVFNKYLSVKHCNCLWNTVYFECDTQFMWLYLPMILCF